MRDLMLMIFVCGWLGGASLPARAGAEALPAQNGTIVITQADEQAIKVILENWREHQSKVSYSSLTEPYFDCEAHRQLLGYGWKAVPFLVGQLARQRSVEVYVGSALIGDRNVRTLEQVYQYNRRRKTHVHNDTLAKWILTGVLGELTSPAASQTQKRTGRTEPADWFDWWHEHKGRFVFPGGKAPDIVIPQKMLRSVPHITTSIKNSLLDFSAVSATYRQMVERAAAEMGIETFIGEHRYIDVIGTVRMKSVTYEEFLYMIGRSIYVLGFDYRKTENGYWVGGDQPAKPRPIFKGWGIMMDRTVFAVGENIPVTIIIRGARSIVDPCDPVFTFYTDFQVTANNGKVVKDFEPETHRPAAKSMLTARADMEVDLLLNRFCKLGPGEYNIRFRYLERQTPTMPIEIYPGNSKTARLLRAPQTRRAKVTNSPICERGKK